MLNLELCVVVVVESLETTYLNYVCGLVKNLHCVGILKFLR
jgi:hypothetical protein